MLQNPYKFHNHWINLTNDRHLPVSDYFRIVTQNLSTQISQLPAPTITAPLHYPPTLQKILDAPDNYITQSDINTWLNGIIQTAVNQERQHWGTDIAVALTAKNTNDGQARSILIFGHSYGEPIQSIQRQLYLYDDRQHHASQGGPDRTRRFTPPQHQQYVNRETFRGPDPPQQQQHETNGPYDIRHPLRTNTVYSTNMTNRNPNPPLQ